MPASRPPRFALSFLGLKLALDAWGLVKLSAFYLPKDSVFLAFPFETLQGFLKRFAFSNFDKNHANHPPLFAAFQNYLAGTVARPLPRKGGEIKPVKA